jgi:hypothetical protein
MSGAVLEEYLATLADPRRERPTPPNQPGDKP